MGRKIKKGNGRIVVDERIMVGKPIISGTRITVEAVIKRLAEGFTTEELLEEYPRLREGDVKAALDYVAKLVANEEIIPKIKIYA
jgi:uncharacterized protein (DUF433 family)